MSTKRRRTRGIDRCTDAGRITIRAGRLNEETRDELDRAIVRTEQSGNLPQLRMLKNRDVSPMEFLEAYRRDRVLALVPEVPLKPLVERWLKSADLREKSRYQYELVWKAAYARLRNEPKLSDINNAWWSEYVVARNVSNVTLERDRAIFKAFLHWAKENGYQIPEFTPKRLKMESKPSGIISLEQVQDVLAKCRVDRLPFFRVLLETGCRSGQARNLRQDDVSKDAVITIHSREGSKNRGKTLHIPVSQELADCLLAMPVGEDGRIFPFSYSTARKWWNELRDGLKAVGVTLHGLRASFITHSLDSGVSPVDVQRIVGHSSLAMTMKYYRNNKERTDAAARMRQAIGVERKDDAAS